MRDKTQEAMQELYQVKGCDLIVNPHEGQFRAYTSDKRFVFVLAGSQSGKTIMAPFWMYNEMQKRGEGDYLVVSPSFQLQQKKCLPVYKTFFEEMLGIGEYVKSERIMYITENNGTQYKLFFGSADNPDSLESATAKAAHLDEAGQNSFRIEAWDAVKRRLSIHRGRVLATTTIYNLGWMKVEVYDRWKAGDDEIDIIQFSSIMNPTFPREEYFKRKETMPAWKFKMFYDGEYERPAGMIYEDFDSEVHKIRPFSIPFSWNRYVGIDPGPIHTAMVWLAHDVEADRFYLYRSSLKGNKTSAEHCREALQYVDSKQVIRWIGGAASEKQFRMDWKDNGINVEPPLFKEVEAGIDRVIRALKERRLFIFDNEENRGFFDEIGSYSRELDENGQPTDKIADKATYHRLDALRYVMQLTGEATTAAPDVTKATGGHTVEIYKSMDRPFI